MSAAAIDVAEFPAFMQRVQATLENPQAEGALTEWHQEFVGDIAKGFQSSETQTGEGWAPLKNPRPAGHNAGTRPLIDTGDLEMSLIGEGEGNILQITPDSLTYGTSDPKAAFHQYGTSRMVARPMLTINDQQIENATNKVARAIIAHYGS